MSNTEYIIVFTTAASEHEGAGIAKALLDEGLCACVNITKEVRSMYKWKDELKDDTEVHCIIKTKKSLYKQVESLIKSMHSYEIPEIIAVDVVDGLADYLSWVGETTK